MTFVLKAEVAGMSKLVKAALLEQTGLRLNKVKCRGNDGDDNDEDEQEASPPIVSGADSERDAGDSDSGEGGDQPPEFVPGVDIGPRRQILAEAPKLWAGTRDTLQNRIDALKQAVQAQLADEGRELVVEIEGHLRRLDRILGKLDNRLTDSLTSALQTQDPGKRDAALKASKGILAEYIRYVRAEPLMEHLDSNPFGVKTDLKATLVKSLAQMAKAIG